MSWQNEKFDAKKYMRKVDPTPTITMTDKRLLEAKKVEDSSPYFHAYDKGCKLEPIAIQPKSGLSKMRALFCETHRSILQILIDIYPEPISKNELAERAEQKATSGGYFNNLGSLRTLGLIDYPNPGYAKAKEILFLE